jgi:hypothetical protein
MRDWERKENNIDKKGAYACDHPLVKYVQQYDKKYFYAYAYKIYTHMKRKKIKVNPKLLEEIREFSNSKTIPKRLKYYKHHNNLYLKVCYYNLLEKYKCNMIPSSEWYFLNNYVRKNLMEV